MKKAYRASLLRFDDAGLPVFDEDGLLVVAPDSTGRQRVVEQAAGRTDEHFTFAILDVPGLFADEHHGRTDNDFPPIFAG